MHCFLVVCVSLSFSILLPFVTLSKQRTLFMFELEWTIRKRIPDENFVKHFTFLFFFLQMCVCVCAPCFCFSFLRAIYFPSIFFLRNVFTMTMRCKTDKSSNDKGQTFCFSKQSYNCYSNHFYKCVFVAVCYYRWFERTKILFICLSSISFDSRPYRICLTSNAFAPVFHVPVKNAYRFTQAIFRTHLERFCVCVVLFMIQSYLLIKIRFLIKIIYIIKLSSYKGCMLKGLVCWFTQLKQNHLDIYTYLSLVAICRFDNPKTANIFYACRNYLVCVCVPYLSRL